MRSEMSRRLGVLAGHIKVFFRHRYSADQIEIVRQYIDFVEYFDNPETRSEQNARVARMLNNRIPGQPYKVDDDL